MQQDPLCLSGPFGGPEESMQGEATCQPTEYPTFSPEHLGLPPEDPKAEACNDGDQP